MWHVAFEFANFEEVFEFTVFLSWLNSMGGPLKVPSGQSELLERKCVVGTIMKLLSLWKLWLCSSYLQNDYYVTPDDTSRVVWQSKL